MDAATVLEEWQGRTGEFSPEYYAYYGPNETSELIRDRLDGKLDTDDAILEIGCSAGRHLAHLQSHGYGELAGVDINHEMNEVMAASYPALAETGRFYEDAIENVVAGFADGQFDAVFSVETLQHIHPDNEWVFEDIARITDRLLITVEIESDGDPGPAVDQSVTYINGDFPLYHRDWGSVFTEFGFVEIEADRVGKDTVRVFEATAS